MFSWIDRSYSNSKVCFKSYKKNVFDSAENLSESLTLTPEKRERITFSISRRKIVKNNAILNWVCYENIEPAFSRTRA